MILFSKSRVWSFWSTTINMSTFHYSGTIKATLNFDKAHYLTLSSYLPNKEKITQPNRPPCVCSLRNLPQILTCLHCPSASEPGLNLLLSARCSPVLFSGWTILEEDHCSLPSSVVRLLFLILWLTYHLQEALCCSGWSPRICWNAAFIMPLPLAIPKTIVCTTTSSGSGELFQSTALPQDLAENIPLSSIPFSVGCSMPTWPCAGSPRKADPLKPLYSYSLLLS